MVLNFYIINIKLLELCNRGENCLWKILRNTQEDKIEVKDFKLKGKGLIAKVPFPKLSFLLDYYGKIINDEEAVAIKNSALKNNTHLYLKWILELKTILTQQRLPCQIC